MSFEKRFSKLIHEDIDDLKTSYKKGGYNKRHHNAKTGSNRKHQNFIPVVHKADGHDNNNVEHMRKSEAGSHVCSPADLIHIINTYIKQGDQAPANSLNVQQLAARYLRPSKQLGTTGMTVVHDPANNTYVIKK